MHVYLLRRIYKTSYYTYSGPNIQTSYCKSMGSSTRSLYIRILIRILGQFVYLKWHIHWALVCSCVITVALVEYHSACVFTDSSLSWYVNTSHLHSTFSVAGPPMYNSTSSNTNKYLNLLRQKTYETSSFDMKENRWDNAPYLAEGLQGWTEQASGGSWKANLKLKSKMLSSLRKIVFIALILKHDYCTTI